MLKPLLTAAVAVLLTACPVLAEWTYTDGGGKTVALPEIPKRIVAHANVAAGLIPLGIRPVGIYVDGPVKDDPSLRGLDLTGIEILGEAWGEIDIEKLAATEPDIIIAEYWPLEKAYSGMEANAADGTLIEQIAPVAGPAQGNSTEALIKDYEALATLLGADLSDPAIAADKANSKPLKQRSSRRSRPSRDSTSSRSGPAPMASMSPPSRARPSSLTSPPGASTSSRPKSRTNSPIGRR